MNLSLQNKVVLLTDNGDFLVSVIARQLEEEGAIPCRIFLNDPESAVQQVRAALARHARIDGLVNTLNKNDKVGLEQGGYTDFLRSLEQNILYAWLITQTCIPWLQTTQGAIVNIISRIAETGQGTSSGYAAANGSRMGLTAAWNEELVSQCIRVNGIVIDEGIAPLDKREVSYREIAQTIAFLLSPAAMGMRGELVHIDGGYVHLGRELDTTT